MEQIEAKIEKAIPLLKQYELLLKKWQKAVNLVSSKSLSDIWKRHILDSAQLYFYIPKTAKVLVDMGSGAGFPALVIAVLNKVYKGTLTDIYLIESDAKKCVFLTEVARELDLSVHILNERLENIQDVKADVITARALADIDKLLQYGKIFLKEKTEFLLLKGENVAQEIQNNHQKCCLELFESQINHQGYIVRITEVQKND